MHRRASNVLFNSVEPIGHYAYAEGVSLNLLDKAEDKCKDSEGALRVTSCSGRRIGSRIETRSHTLQIYIIDW